MRFSLGQRLKVNYNLEYFNLEFLIEHTLVNYMRFSLGQHFKFNYKLEFLIELILVKNSMKLSFMVLNCKKLEQLKIIIILKDYMVKILINHNFRLTYNFILIEIQPFLIQIIKYILNSNF